MAISVQPPPPSRPAPRVQLSLRPAARARPPWKTGKGHSRARAPAEDRRKGPRKGAAGGGGRRAATQREPAACSRPPAPLTPGPAPEKKEPLQGCRAPPLTKGNRGSSRDQENGAEAGWGHGRTVRDGSTGNSTEGLAAHTGSSRGRLSSGEKETRSARRRPSPSEHAAGSYL